MDTPAAGREDSPRGCLHERGADILPCGPLAAAGGTIRAGGRRIRPPSPRPVSERRVPSPNGWRLAPAGQQVPLGDLPLALALHPGGRYLFVTHNGFGEHSVDAVDLDARKVVSRAAVRSAWLGLGVAPGGGSIFAGGGVSNSVLGFSFTEGALRFEKEIRIAPRGVHTFPGGLCIAGSRLYVANNLANSLSAIDLETGAVIRTIEVGDHPYTCIPSPDGKRIFVSLWGAAQVVAFDSESLEVAGRAMTDDHPNAMVVTPDGRRLFVANANSNTVSAVDLGNWRTREQISVALYPGQPGGQHAERAGPLAGWRPPLVANADNNNVAVFDFSRAGREPRSLGFIPAAGTRRRAREPGRAGRSTSPTARAGTLGPNPARSRSRASRSLREDQYIAEMFRAPCRSFPCPDAGGHSRGTRRRHTATCPYDAEAARMRVPLKGTARFPAQRGRQVADPVRHLHRQGEPHLRPGARRHARGQRRPVALPLPRGGHPQPPRARARVRPAGQLLRRERGQRRRPRVDHGRLRHRLTSRSPGRSHYGPAARQASTDFEGARHRRAQRGTTSGTARREAGVSYRSYGELVGNGKTPADPATPRVAGLEGHFDPCYRGFDTDLPRPGPRRAVPLRVAAVRGARATCRACRSCACRNDHTFGTAPGAPTPRPLWPTTTSPWAGSSRAISRSKFWPQTAIFVVEDDAQNGPDHVDAHRTVGLRHQPLRPARRRGLARCTPPRSMLRTIELILGLRADEPVRRRGDPDVRLIRHDGRTPRPTARPAPRTPRPT